VTLSDDDALIRVTLGEERMNPEKCISTCV